MNKKHKQVLGVFFLNFLIICIFLSANVKAQDYNIELKANDEFVWEIKELNIDKFESIFNTEPNFGVGDQIKMIIREVDDVEGLRWSIVVEFWDYGTDWTVSGEIQYLSIYKSPYSYNDFLFVPTPVDKYFEDAMKTLSSDYYLSSASTIGKQAISSTGINYRVEKNFDIHGILFSETYFDKGSSVVVKLEGTFFMVPLGFSFLGFMAIAIISIIAIFYKKNKTRFF